MLLVLVPDGYQATIIGSPHLQIRHNLSGLYLADWKWLHPILIAFNTLCPVEFYIQRCVALHHTHWGLYFEKLICPCLGIWFSQKATSSKFFKAHISIMRNHWAIIFYYVIIRLILNLFFKALYIPQKNYQILVAKILATKFGFVPDCFDYIVADNLAMKGDRASAAIA